MRIYSTNQWKRNGRFPANANVQETTPQKGQKGEAEMSKDGVVLSFVNV